MKTIAMTLTALSLALAAPAFAADTKYNAEVDIEKDADGNYKKTVTQKATDHDGTTHKKEMTTEVDVDSDGSRETTVETKSVKDPDGLFNSTTVKTKDSVTEKDGKVKTSHKKTVNGEVVEEVEQER